MAVRAIPLFQQPERTDHMSEAAEFKAWQLLKLWDTIYFSSPGQIDAGRLSRTRQCPARPRSIVACRRVWFQAETSRTLRYWQMVPTLGVNINYNSLRQLGSRSINSGITCRAAMIAAAFDQCLKVKIATKKHRLPGSLERKS
jgi:hypothetical protein